MATYTGGGRNPDAAIELGERVIDEAFRVLGPEHAEPRTVQALLMSAYNSRDRTEEVTAILDRYPVPDDNLDR